MLNPSAEHNLAAATGAAQLNGPSWLRRDSAASRGAQPERHRSPLPRTSTGLTGGNAPSRGSATLRAAPGAAGRRPPCGEPPQRRLSPRPRGSPLSARAAARCHREPAGKRPSRAIRTPASRGRCAPAPPLPGGRGRSSPHRRLSRLSRWVGRGGAAGRRAGPGWARLEVPGERHGATGAVELGGEVPAGPGALSSGAQFGLRLRVRGLPAGGGLGRARRGERGGLPLAGLSGTPPRCVAASGPPWPRAFCVSVTGVEAAQGATRGCRWLVPEKGRNPPNPSPGWGLGGQAARPEPRRSARGGP